MDISLTGTRPAATLTQPLNVTLELKTPIVDTTEGYFLFPFGLDNVAPNPLNFTTPAAVTYSTSAPTLTTTGGGFANVRPGDRVQSTMSTASSDFTTQYVVSKSIDNNTVTLNINPDGATGSGAPVRFVPPTTDLALFYVKVDVALNGSVLNATVTLIPVPEGIAIDADHDGDTFDNITFSALTPERAAIVKTIDLDSYLTAVRVGR